MISDMTPSFTQNDLSDGIVAETKISTDIGGSFASGVARSDNQDNLLGKTLSVSTVLKRVLGISLRSNPFKIGQDVIGSDEINMVNLRQSSRVGNKSYSHQAMDWMMFHLPIAVSKSNPSISIFIGLWRKNSWRLGNGLSATPKWVSDNTSQTTDTSDAGNFIQTLVAHDRAPLFDSHIASPKACDLTQAVYARSWGICQHSELLRETQESKVCQ